MFPQQFTLEISYSQIAIFNATLEQPFNNWTEAHFKQGFVWRSRSVSFRTANRTGLATVTVDTPVQQTLRSDAVFAISVPFLQRDQAIEIASVFEGEPIELPPGDYELLFQSGRDGPRQWVSLQFIARKIAGATIHKGVDVDANQPLLMTGEPA